MHRLRAKRKFDPSRPVYARRAIPSCHGRRFEPREVVPWKEMGISLRTILAWFRLRRVSHDPGGDRLYESQLTDDQGNRTDGPTIEEFVAAGYLPEYYPPPGWAVRDSDGYRQFSATGEGPWELQTQVPESLPHIREIAGNEVHVEEVDDPVIGEDLMDEPIETLDEDDTAESSETIVPEPAPVVATPAKPAPRGRRKG